MGRLAALLSKELRQHLVVGAGLLVVVPLSWALLAAGVAVSPDNITYLMTHVYFLWVFLPLTAIVVGNRLVVAEYHGRTQLFLESLPIRRVEVFSVKAALGLAVVLLTALTSLFAAVVLAASTEPVGGRFLGLMLVRTLGYSLCLWFLLFMLGFLGRFRVPIIIALVVIDATIDSLTAFETEHWGPFGLVDELLALDRVTLPTEELVTTLILSLVFIVVAAALALINEGSVAESLAKSMSLREKSFAGGLLIAGLLALIAAERNQEPAPFSFGDTAVLASDQTELEIYYVRDEARDDAERLLSALEGDLALLGETLGRTKLPMARVALRESLDGQTVEPVELARDDGVLLRANFRSPSHDVLRAAVIRELLDVMSGRRARFEPLAWFLEGFSRWLVAHRSGANDACRRAPESCPLMLRALWLRGRQGTLEPAALERWILIRESQGEGVAAGLAFSALSTLEQERGVESIGRLARALYAEEAPQDCRAVVAARRLPLSRLLQRETGLEWDDFIARWNEQLVVMSEGSQVGEALASLPRAEVSITVSAGTGAIRDVVVQVSVDAAGEDEVVVAVLHHELLPFDEPLDPAEVQLEREERLVEGAARERLEVHIEGRYGPGTRVFLAVELESVALGCPLRFHAERRTIE